MNIWDKCSTIGKTAPFFQFAVQRRSLAVIISITGSIGTTLAGCMGVFERKNFDLTSTKLIKNSVFPCTKRERSMREVGCISYSNRSIDLGVVGSTYGSTVGVEEEYSPVNLVSKVGSVA